MLQPHFFLLVASCFMTPLLHGLLVVSSCTLNIYSVDTILYSYTLPLIHLPYSSSSLCLSCNLSSSLRSLQVWHYLGYSWLAHQAGDLYPYPWYHHVHGLSTSVHPLCVFQTWHSFPYYLWQRLRVCVKLLLIFRHYSWHAALLHFRLLSWRWWTNWIHESDSRAIPLCIL